MGDSAFPVPTGGGGSGFDFLQEAQPPNQVVDDITWLRSNGKDANLFLWDLAGNRWVATCTPNTFSFSGTAADLGAGSSFFSFADHHTITMDTSGLFVRWDYPSIIVSVYLFARPLPNADDGLRLRVGASTFNFFWNGVDRIRHFDTDIETPGGIGGANRIRLDWELGATPPANFDALGMFQYKEFVPAL